MIAAKQYIIYGLIILFTVSGCNQDTDNIDRLKQDSSEVSEDRLNWFRDAKFGMFIHWGLYAVPAGEWEGKTHYGEWLQWSAKIPNDEYEKFAAEFNPINYNPKEWVNIAKSAGMRYIVITAKHHDGFCMYDTELTDYDIVDATPYNKDPMKELAKECEEAGIKLCFYYSDVDWHHPEFSYTYSQRRKTHPDGFHGDTNSTADISKYADYMKGQVSELLTNYGPVGIIWFDGGGSFRGDSKNELLDAQGIVDRIHELQPNCLINDRLQGVGADYGTPEQHIPSGTKSVPFEVCMTLNNHWGYNKNDNNWKDARTVVRNLAEITSKGGNYLLNVGPDALGTIPAESVNILKQTGKWIETYGESIYGASPLHKPLKFRLGVMTSKPGKIYLHVFNWPEDGLIFLDGFTDKFKNAYLLSDNQKTSLKTDVYRRSLMIHVPMAPTDELNSVVVLEIEDKGKPY